MAKVMNAYEKEDAALRRDHFKELGKRKMKRSGGEGDEGSHMISYTNTGKHLHSYRDNGKTSHMLVNDEGEEI